MKTKSQIEVEVGEAVVKFEKEFLGRGPEETKVYLIDDMLVIRLRGVLTPAEKQLARSDPEGRGRNLIKQLRMELIEKARAMLDALITDIVGVAVRSLHTDVSTVTGERLLVFSLEGRPSVRD